ncbi:hypothetical protein PENANT_c002G04649 [Penicillium antarcticum]|uniref:Uncharacterized protein n=1 Tax=Penicillium antarcticum TaxID=416450 RepID=A0A1V6QK26_9EURO|nr:hypothetical protein PENANT_c002G04649 [Penicillium antarcticum]
MSHIRKTFVSGESRITAA